MAESNSTQPEAAAPRVGKVDFGDLRRLQPISAVWGFDRGRPIDRYYIERFLEQHSSDIYGRVLEVESNAYTRQFGGTRVRESDVLHISGEHPGATIVADLAEGSAIPSGAFDCVILTQTMQYIYDVRAATKTLQRILKPGGTLLATFPGLSRTSDVLWGHTWHWNLTSRSARRLFAEFFSDDGLIIQGYGNILAAIAFLHGLAVEEMETQELDYYDSGYEICVSVRAKRG